MSYLTLCILETLANSEDPDEIQHKAEFHQGLPCLLNKIKTILRDKNASFYRNNL